MDIRAIGEQLADKWFDSANSRVFVDRHLSEVKRMVTVGGIFAPGINTVDIVQAWEEVRNRYLTIPDDIPESFDTLRPKGAQILGSTSPLRLDPLRCLTQRWFSPQALT